MDLQLGTQKAAHYQSASQKARILTEHWVRQCVYCPNCGETRITPYPNNRPVADFCCPACHEDYELKSKQAAMGMKIVDGAYATMIERLQASNNPNFFFLNYDAGNFSVKNFIVIPKHFFVPAIIEKRKPLAATARRAGWTGCNILLRHIPQTGKIFYVRDGCITPKKQVLAAWQKTLFLRDEAAASKGWLLDVMQCVDRLGKTDFTLDDLYAFEPELSHLHPDNRHIRDKIRQQLQRLRDKGYLEFVARGHYRVVPAF